MTGGTAGLSSVVKLQVPLGSLGAEERRKGRVGEEEGGWAWRKGMEGEGRDGDRGWRMIIFIFE